MAWPTTSDPRSVFVTVRFTAHEAAELDALAAASGASRSEAVRDCVDRVISARKKQARRANALAAQHNPAGA